VSFLVLGYNNESKTWWGVRFGATGGCEEAYLQEAEANALLAADNGEYELHRWVINTPREKRGT
jgi:hypothetical protein